MHKFKRAYFRVFLLILRNQWERGRCAAQRHASGHCDFSTKEIEKCSFKWNAKNDKDEIPASVPACFLVFGEVLPKFNFLVLDAFLA